MKRLTIDQGRTDRRTQSNGSNAAKAVVRRNTEEVQGRGRFDVSFLWLQGFWSNEKISTNRDLPSIHELDVWCDDNGITVFQSLPHFDSGFRS
jgi:hypothetical protein